LKTSGETRIPVAVTWTIFARSTRTPDSFRARSMDPGIRISERAPMIVAERPHILE
jgi:hypothetical protein